MDTKIPPTRPLTVSLETHGCKLNQADTGLLQWQFEEAGFNVVTNNQPVDVYVLNTCTVTHISDRKARQSLRNARRRNPKAIIVATGCYAERSPDQLDKLSEIDLIVGNKHKKDIVERVLTWRNDIPIPCSTGADLEMFSPKIAKTRAMVKIQEGCNQVCAYCIVPKVRGRERSRTPQEILEEIEKYITLGYQEVVLTGTQLGSYGFDLRAMNLTKLVRKILIETDFPRLRISSLQPQEIDDEFLELWSDSRLCPHFHLPLQSGSDSILKRMNRRYSSSQYKLTVDKIRNRIPGSAISADVIIGFPGESDYDFDQTFSFCENTEFAGIHVFPYSVRPGTTAYHLPDQVSPEVKDNRMGPLLELARKDAFKYRQTQIGEELKVLWEEVKYINGSLLWSGLTTNYVRVFTDSTSDLANRITTATIASQQDDLVFACIKS